MKLMRSTKTGSVCADCGTEIAIGDPIAYFGPHAVYGLTCHENPKAAKHLAKLLNEEATVRNSPPKVMEGTEQQMNAPKVPVPHEWVVELEWRSDVGEHECYPLLEWLMKGGYCGQIAGKLNLIEFRSPRNIGLGISKQWAERTAKELEKLNLGVVSVNERVPF